MSKTVNKPTDVVEKMRSATVLHRNLAGGTKAMREAGQTHLPKFPAEEREDYDSRLARSFLYGGYTDTIEKMIGRVFAKPVTLKTEGDAEVTGDFDEWAKDVDLEGQNLNNFAMQVLEDGMQTGISFILVDAPRREGDVTRTQAQAMGLRPYLVHLTIEQILGWKVTKVANRSVLSQLRISETIKVPDTEDEFNEKEIEQVRVLTVVEAQVSVRIFRKSQDKTMWMEVSEEAYFIPVPEIRLVPFYTKRTAFLQAKPPLTALAEANEEHWQSASDQRNILHVARVPTLCIKGMMPGENDDKFEFAIGSSKAIELDLEGSAEWVEHSGAAIDAGRQDIMDIEARMQALGLQLIARRTDGGATGAAIDDTKETSILLKWAEALEDTLTTALMWMGDFANQAAPVATVFKDLTIGAFTEGELRELREARRAGDISQQTYLNELKRRGMLHDSVEVEDEIERTEEEAMLALARMPDMSGEGDDEDVDDDDGEGGDE